MSVLVIQEIASAYVIDSVKPNLTTIGQISYQPTLLSKHRFHPINLTRSECFSDEHKLNSLVLLVFDLSLSRWLQRINDFR